MSGKKKGKKKKKSTWKKEDGLIVQELNTKVGFSNIKIYGRQITEENKNLAFDEETDEVIIYLCGHTDGYDETKSGYVLKADRFIELTVYIVRQYNNALFKPIKLRERDIKAILKFIYTLDEDDLLGEVANKAEVLKKWAKELENILEKHRNEIALYLEIYE